MRRPRIETRLNVWLELGPEFFLEGPEGLCCVGFLPLGDMAEVMRIAIELKSIGREVHKGAHGRIRGLTAVN